MSDEPKYTARAATPEDIETVVAMGRKFYETQVKPLTGIPFDEGTVVLRLLQLMEDTGLVILVETQEGEAVGAITAAYGPYPFNSNYLVCREEALWVEPEHRSAGVGAALVQVLAGAAKLDGCTHLAMSSLANSPPAAAAIYRALGHTEVETAFLVSLED